MWNFRNKTKEQRKQKGERERRRGKPRDKTLNSREQTDGDQNGAWWKDG